MIKNILFDFDGVILDSMPIRELGFREILRDYPDDKVAELLQFHNDNGGLSRFVKIRYFFEEIMEQSISEEELYNYTDQFSKIMRRELVKESYQIRETVSFIRNNSKRYRLFIVSGSEQNELRYLCQKQGIDQYFIDILGSPIEKIQLVTKLVKEANCVVEETILIGDSMNDYEAASKNKIEFYGYNAPHLRSVSFHYITSYDSFLE